MVKINSMNAHITVREIESCIAEIPDPEIPVITIRDLGILRGVEYNGGRCEVTITPTYTACPAMPMIEQQIKDICHHKGIDDVNVRTVYSPAWSTDWISEEAKEKLRRYGIAPPRHSSCNKVLYHKHEVVHCPRCNSIRTDLISRFGSTACKAYYQCHHCNETFEQFKCH